MTQSVVREARRHPCHPALRDRDHRPGPSSRIDCILDRMFVRYFLELPRPFEDVERALLSHPEDWVPGPARAAEARGKRLLTEVGLGPERRRLEKQVEIELGEPIRFPSKTALPMSWRPIGAEVLFPLFEADIEVAGLGRELTQLALSARYRPPLGAVGRVIDRALLHRVAEAIVKDFLDRAGEALLQLVPSSRSA